MYLNSCMSFACMKAKKILKNFFSNESGEVNVVAIVVLIAVAVVLALFFKDQIGAMIDNLIKQISGKAADTLTDYTPK